MKIFKNIMKVLFVIVGLLALFAPYEFEREENGDFSYRAWLLGIDGKTDDESEKRKYRVWFFNKPKLKGIDLRLRKSESDFDAEEEFSNLADSINDEFEDLADRVGESFNALEEE